MTIYKESFPQKSSELKPGTHFQALHQLWDAEMRAVLGYYPVTVEIIDPDTVKVTDNADNTETYYKGSRINKSFYPLVFAPLSPIFFLRWIDKLKANISGKNTFNLSWQDDRTTE